MSMPKGATYESVGQRYCAACHVQVGECSFLFLARAVGFFVATALVPVTALALGIGLMFCEETGSWFGLLSVGLGCCLAWVARWVLVLLWKGIRFQVPEQWHYCEVKRALVHLPCLWPHAALLVVLPLLASWLAMQSVDSWLMACWVESSWELLRALALLGASVLFVVKTIGLARRV